jgi:hypothetical protein
MADEAASSTDGGGGKSGSPTQREVTLWPSDSICLTREKTSTVLEGLIWERSGLSEGVLLLVAPAEEAAWCADDLDTELGSWRRAGDNGEKAALREECDRSAAARRDGCFMSLVL